MATDSGWRQVEVDDLVEGLADLLDGALALRLLGQRATGDGRGDAEEDEDASPVRREEKRACGDLTCCGRRTAGNPTFPG
jgi:hypothetical protein